MRERHKVSKVAVTIKQEEFGFSRHASASHLEDQLDEGQKHEKMAFIAIFNLQITIFKNERELILCDYSPLRLLGLPRRHQMGMLKMERFMFLSVLSSFLSAYIRNNNNTDIISSLRISYLQGIELFHTHRCARVSQIHMIHMIPNSYILMSSSFSDIFACIIYSFIIIYQLQIKK